MASTQAPLRRGLLFVATHGAYSPRSDAADPDMTIPGCEIARMLATTDTVRVVRPVMFSLGLATLATGPTLNTAVAKATTITSSFRRTSSNAVHRSDLSRCIASARSEVRSVKGARACLRFGHLETFESDTKISRKAATTDVCEPPREGIVLLDFHWSTK